MASCTEFSSNGLNLLGTVFPEPVLEIVMSKVPIEDFLNMNQVCRVWRQITKQITFWKFHLESNKIPWSLVPEYLKQKENFWVVMYMHCKRSLLTTNFVKNPSGAMGFDHWQITQNGGDQMQVEQPPTGCDSVPADPRFPDTNVCFVTSYEWSEKVQEIDLWEYGLNSITMEALLPFRIEVTEKYTARFDCGGIYALSVRLRDNSHRVVLFKRRRALIPRTTKWESTYVSFDFLAVQPSMVKDLRYLSFKDGGRDNQFWAGHYGTKLAQACVRVVPLGDRPEVDYSSDGAQHSDSSEDDEAVVLMLDNYEEDYEDNNVPSDEELELN